MKTHIKLLLLVLLCLASNDISARGRGLYGPGPRNFRLPTQSQQHTFIFGLSASYYYGDVEAQGIPILSGVHSENIGAGLQLAYRYKVNPYFGIRTELQGGLLRADNSAYFARYYPSGKAYRKFNSVYAMPEFGIEWFPAGKMFYIYLGAEACISHIRWDFSGSAGNRAAGVNLSILPMVGLEFGWDIKLNRTWTIIPFIGIHQGLVDSKQMNLDGWPSVPVINAQGVEVSYGTTGANKLPDGFLQIGLSVSINLTERNYRCLCEFD